MTLRYTIEQLVQLRSSSLVCKPESLPPLEDWMGPPPDQRQKGFAQLRGKLDDQASQAEITQRRPNLTDTHNVGRKLSSAAPGDIVLGPPKTAFASANSRNSLKSFSGDTSEETSSFSNRLSTHERLSREHEVVDGEKREGRFNGINSRRLGRDDREGWQNGRRRHQDEDQGDGRHRRNGDREKGRWDREQDGGGDPKRLSRDAARREGRGKFEQPWFRGDKAQEVDSGSRSANKPHEWRKDRASGRGHEGDRSMKAEQDPEWMDSTIPSEPKQAHTQEEFQRWKESMKASEETSQNVPEKPEVVRKREVKQPEPPPMPAFLDSSEVDLSMDKFFAAYSDSKISSEQKPPEAKAHRKPRFAALFTPQAEAAPKGPSLIEPTEVEQPSVSTGPQPASVPADANKADQEHFQRVLQMLAGRSSNSRPQTADPSKPPDNTFSGDFPSAARESRSPLAEALSKRDPTDVREHTIPTEGPGGAVEPAGNRPAEARQPTPRRDTDLLLQLMQQSGLAADSKSPQPTTGASPLTGMFSQQTPAEKVNHNLAPFFDDPTISKTHGPGPVPSRNSQQRRPTNGPQGTFYDDTFFANLHHTSQKATPNLESGNQARPPNLPPGMPRPPGFDQIMSAPPPGWQTQVAHRPPPSQQPPAPMNPPPGIPNHIVNAVYGPGPGSALPPPLRPTNHIISPTSPHQPQIPRPQHQQQQQLRQLKYPTDTVGAPGQPLGPGPGGPPPAAPGFLNLNGPPPPALAPGYMNMPPGVGGGRRDGGGPPAPSQLPPQFLDSVAGGNIGRMMPRHHQQMMDRPD